MYTPSVLQGATALLALATHALAQDIDFDMVDAAANVSYYIVADATAQTVTYDATSIIAAATSAITSVTVAITDVANATTVSADAASSTAAALSTAAAQSTAAALSTADLDKRSATTIVSSGCSTAVAQATGYGPVPSPDTPSAFLAFASFSSVASAAPTPSGYTNTFTNQQASNNAYGYLGYTTLKTYDTTSCAAKCNAINGCMGINIYYERDPTVNPISTCNDPSSTTNIKCVFWGGEVSSDSLSNTGQYRQLFEVVIAGSNGYMNNTLVPLTGYSEPVYYDTAAINAPYDSQGYNTYMGSTIFTTGPFNASLCADYCAAQNTYNEAHPASDGSPVQTCQFFNTYILYINTTKDLQGQYCAIYSETWSSTYATNVGQYRGSDEYLIEYSYGYSNSTNPGTACKSCAIAQATREISASSQQGYCSTYLGYSEVTSTVSAFFTVTPVATTTATVDVAQKRSATSTPDNLTKYPTSVVSSACSLVATAGGTTTITVTPTITATASITTVYTTVTST